jgi:hypothetical protein
MNERIKELADEVEDLADAKSVLGKFIIKGNV